ncbi:hypothetical protein B566_EDAN016777 [Ephemera danica]|nr:hypothetical protein B566_EDAN016777 [Ephemera danica]
MQAVLRKQQMVVRHGSNHNLANLEYKRVSDICSRYPVTMSQRTASIQEQVLSILERPTEPAENYILHATSLKTRFSVGDITQVALSEIALPDISEFLELPRHGNISLFIPYHRQLATKLIGIFMAVLHRPDTRNISLPPHSEIFPQKFFDGAVLNQAREQANILVEESTRTPIEIPQDYTASNLEMEHRLAYFREDLGINLHHWHWHLVYPHNDPIEIAKKDRRGELFYYMHQQMVARYDFERLSNSLLRVKRLTNLYEPIEEAYFPKLNNLVASRVWAPRQSGTKLKNIDRKEDKLKFDLQDLMRWRDRIFDAIHKGHVKLPDGTSQPLDEEHGIDLLGNIIEASVLSTNYAYYGDLHNFGHVALAQCHDPDQRHLESFGVMGDTATAMRDPVFYRWHAYINDVFLEHKNTLPRYTVPQLAFQGIRITDIEVVTPNFERNTLQTFWQKSDVDLSRGLDFAPHVGGNSTNGPRTGTVRIFMAPKFDERNQPLQLLEQKNLFIELDRFVVTLENNPNMKTTITQNSLQSSVTIPFEPTFRELETTDPAEFCGCGWPQHMLIPKGNAEGMECQLFVMVSNYNDDRVEQPNCDQKACAEAMSYCGVRDQLYPDKRSMGYPFDRLPRDGVTTLEDFLTPNMGVIDVRIKFSNVVRNPISGAAWPKGEGVYRRISRLSPWSCGSSEWLLNPN